MGHRAEGNEMGGCFGAGALVEMKPIFCDCKTKPQFGGFMELSEM